MTPPPFRFFDPGPLLDGDLSLVLAEKVPGDPVKGWAPAYHFEMRRVGDQVVMGRLRLRIGDGDGELRYPGNVGYDVVPEHRGRRLAARSMRLILPLARQHGLTALWIGCRPDNIASRRSCELAGAAHIDTLEVPPDHPLRQHDVSVTRRYRLDV